MRKSSLDDILVQMKIMSKEKIEELRSEYKTCKAKYSFNKFLINRKEITHEQLRVAILRKKSNVG